MTGTTDRCKVRIGTLRRCSNPSVDELEICWPCLDTLLDEADPRRRRSLAAVEGLPDHVVDRLAGDADERVRARVAARPELSAALAQQFASESEASPIVWRALAASIHGVRLADALVATGDSLTLATLAAHPDLDDGLLNRLANHPDPEVSTTAIATRAGLRPDPTIQLRIEQGARAETRPITSPPKGTPVPGPLPPPPPLEQEPPAPLTPVSVSVPESPLVPFVAPVLLDEARPTEAETAIGHWQEPLSSVATTDDTAKNVLSGPAAPSGESRSRRAMAIVGAAAIVVAILGGVTQVQHHHQSIPSATPPTTTGQMATSTSGPTSSTVAATMTPTTTKPTAPLSTVPPGLAPTLPSVPPTPTPQQVAPAPLEAPPVPSGPVTRSIQVTSASGRFCGRVRLTVNFSPSQAAVTVYDDRGHQVGNWSGPSGETRTLELTDSTSALVISAKTQSIGLALSASAASESC